jgi:hypothetical protein
MRIKVYCALDAKDVSADVILGADGVSPQEQLVPRWRRRKAGGQGWRCGGHALLGGRMRRRDRHYELKNTRDVSKNSKAARTVWKEGDAATIASFLAK